MAASLALIIILGLLADYVASRLKIPGLVGMLVAGVICGPYVFNLMAPEMMTVSGDFRKIALIVILLRAGFELHRDTLHRVGRTALIMSCIPALFEIAGVMLVAPKLLHITYMEAALLGTILAAVSPAVVVPLMIDFMDRGRGTRKGIPTLVLAASSIDDVFVIVLFTVLLGMVGGTAANMWIALAHIPLSVILGILVGILPGYLLFRLFTTYDWRPPKRTILVLGTAIFISWLETACEAYVPIASLLGVMAIGFIILEKSQPIAHIISQKLKKLWVFAELLLFVLVGAQVNIHVAWDAGLTGAAVIVVGLGFRSLGTYLSLIGSNLNFAEKMFCIVAYVPKATVQAAIGALPLAAGVAGGEVILAVAVLSILLTAPVGAIATKFMGERVLDQSRQSVYRFKDIKERMGLPRVGEKVRSKHFGTVWKIIEEKEVWLKDTDQNDDATDSQQMIPAIYLRYWKEGSGTQPGTGKTLYHRYSYTDPSFDEHWEILYDW
ncbi:MAG: cation:proton antiporter [Desulfobacterales bacterium]|nr:cation:proton antiporter [Desulfobacterales bacterium]